VRMGKGEKFRKVPLGSEARRLVRAWIDVRGEQPGPLITSDRGGRLSARGIQKRIRALGKAAGIKLTPHMLRHTGAMRMVRAGRPLTEVQKILGHAKLETTARYVVPGWEDLEKAVESIELGGWHE
jgi:site-specific recombinase XerC